MDNGVQELREKIIHHTRLAAEYEAQLKITLLMGSPPVVEGRMLTVTQAAKRCGVVRQTIHNAIKKNRIQGTYDPGSRAWRIPLQEVERYRKDEGL